MKEIGLYLQTERKKQSLSLEDVADRTKIHLTKLKAIEEGDLSALPAKVFCVGLIKSYAKELKVDIDKINALCEEAFNESSPVSIHEENSSNLIENEDSSESQALGLFQVPKIVAYLGSLLVIVVLIGGIYTVVEKLQSYSQEETLPGEVFTSTDEASSSAMPPFDESPSEVPPPTDPVTSDPPERTAPSAKKENTKIVETKSKEETKESVQEKQIEAKPQVSIKAEDKSTDEDLVDDSGFEDVDKTEASSNTLVSDNKLVVTALEPIRAEVVWADGYVQVMLLKSQETKTLVFSSPIKLRINNGGAVQVSFNDKEKQVPGSFNQPIELNYP